MHSLATPFSYLISFISIAHTHTARAHNHYHPLSQGNFSEFLSNDLLNTMSDGLLTVVFHIAQAIGFCHARDIVHRDIKTANILLRSDFSAGLSDFGDAIDRKDKEALRKASLVTGSPYYASPEVLKGESSALLPSSDIFSFGVVLLETGDVCYDKAYLGASYLSETPIDSVRVAFGGIDAPQPQEVGTKIAGGWRPSVLPAFRYHHPMLVDIISS